MFTDTTEFLLSNKDKLLIQLTALQVLQLQEDLLDRPFVDPLYMDEAYLIDELMKKEDDFHIELFSSVYKCLMYWALKDSNAKIYVQQKIEWLLNFVLSMRLIMKLRDNLGESMPSFRCCKFVIITINKMINILRDNAFSLMFDLLVRIKDMIQTYLRQQNKVEDVNVEDNYDIVELNKNLVEIGDECDIDMECLSSVLTLKVDTDKTIQRGFAYANMDYIWLEVDHSPDRLILQSTDKDNMTIVKSASKGTLQMFKTELLWLGNEIVSHKDGNSSSAVSDEKKVALRLDGKIDVFKGKYPSEPSLLSEESLSASSKSSQKEKLYFIGIYTKNKVFRFYPFLEEEVGRIGAIFNHLTGMSLMNEAEIIHSIYTQNIIKLRYKVLEKLMKTPSPYIETMVELHKIITQLCDEENEVTKEAFEELRKLWHGAKSEDVQIKILLTIDRLLTPIILKS
ncbi:hypothetical protein ROZALSC1DRAFT_27740, partial [Rozella allomycis CSF55]